MIYVGKLLAWGTHSNPHITAIFCYQSWNELPADIKGIQKETAGSGGTKGGGKRGGVEKGWVRKNW